MKLIMWLVVSTAAWGMESVPVEELRAALKKYQGMESLDVDFRQTKTLKDMDFKVESEGHLFISPPDLVVWRLTKPAAMKVQLNKDEITVESKGQQNRIETNAIPPAQRQEFLNMLSWLKLDADAIARGYTVGRLGPRSYLFAAREGGSIFKSMAMTLDRDEYLQSVLFKEKSGDEMYLRFYKPKLKYAQKQK